MHFCYFANGTNSRLGEARHVVAGFGNSNRKPLAAEIVSKSMIPAAMTLLCVSTRTSRVSRY